MNALTSSHVSNFDGAVHEINFSDTNYSACLRGQTANSYVQCSNVSH